MKYRSLPLRLALALLAFPASMTVAADAGAVASAELYQNQTFTYGRFEARVRFAAGDGVISSFFLWKPGSEVAGTFWNELDFEKLGADCHLQTTPLFGLPVVDHGEVAMLDADLCGEYHTYGFEWTPSYIAYTVDGVEVRRDGEETAAAFATNAASGMQIHFNIWPGDATFGGNFDPAILPIEQFISWVQYSSFADGAFTFQWREEFDGVTVPSGWAVGNWASPKNLSTHQPANVALDTGVAVLSLTADDATGFAGAPPPDPDAGSAPAPDPSGGASGAAGAGGSPSAPPTDEASGGAEGGAAPTGAAGAYSTGTPSGAAASGAGETSSAGAAGMAAAGATSRAASSDGSCSHVAGSGSRSESAAWLGLGAIALAVVQRRRRWPEKGRTGARRPPA